MNANDPIEALDHDHLALGRFLDELVVLFARARAGEAEAVGDEITDLLEGLRDDLFLHFAREEEGLFPFVVAKLPDLVDAVRAIEAAHDAICGALSRMTHLAAHGVPRNLDALATLFERFLTGYHAHALEERTFLALVDGRLDAVQRGELAALVGGV